MNLFFIKIYYKVKQTANIMLKVRRRYIKEYSPDQQTPFQKECTS